MNVAEKLAGWLVCLLGLAHVVVGHAVFLEPTERRIWFASAGFLLIVTGLANLGVQGGSGLMHILAAAMGSLSILVIGVLLAAADQRLLAQPQTLVLLALGLLLTVQRLRSLARLGAAIPREGSS